MVRFMSNLKVMPVMDGLEACNVISSNGFAIFVPPVPRATSSSPAAFNCDNSFRIMTGFTFVLAAIKSLVTLYSF